MQRNIPVESLLGPCCFSHLSLVTESRVKGRTQAKIKSHIIAHFNIVKKLHFRGPRRPCFPRVFAHRPTSPSCFICLLTRRLPLLASSDTLPYQRASQRTRSADEEEENTKLRSRHQGPRMTLPHPVYRKSRRNTRAINRCLAPASRPRCSAVLRRSLQSPAADCVWFQQRQRTTLDITC